jgi:hypothetical protein
MPCKQWCPSIWTNLLTDVICVAERILIFQLLDRLMNHVLFGDTSWQVIGKADVAKMIVKAQFKWDEASPNMPSFGLESISNVGLKNYILFINMVMKAFCYLINATLMYLSNQIISIWVIYHFGLEFVSCLLEWFFLQHISCRIF